MKTWYRMEVKEEDPSIADIYIYDIIGDWIDQMLNDIFGEQVTVTAKAFIEELGKLPDSVTALKVHVNSPGGDVFGAVAIANALRDQRTAKGRTVETSVEGLAASAASFIIQAGDPIRMSDNSLIMIHNPWTVVAGEAAELRSHADELDTIRNAIIATYQWHSDLEADDIAALMDATTWMDADEAVGMGFATEKVEGLKVAASLDPRGLAKLTVPDQYKERVAALVKPEPPVEPAPKAQAAEPAEVLRLCREADCIDLAEELVVDASTLEEVNARLTTEKETRTAAKARAEEIKARCEKANLPELAEGYTNGSMTLGDIGKHLATITAKLDSVVIDGNLDPDQGTRPKQRIDISKVYSNRNRLLVAEN